MKKILSLFLFLIAITSIAQQKGDITINWTGTKDVSFDVYSYKVPQFDVKNFDFDASEKVIFYNTSFTTTSEINEKSLEITNVVYESISNEELGSLSKSAIPTKITATISNIKARDSYKAALKISPIIKDGATFKKIKSFTYAFTNGNNARLTPGNDDFNSRFNSVLATGEWFRFYVTKSGAYRIDKSFLQSLGMNPDAIDPRKIKLYGNGGRMIPLRNSEYYPADLTENAILVAGENDGVFNDGDYVAFYAEGVDVFNLESDTNNNLYADRSYYYINAQGANGKRIVPMTQPSAAATLSINTFDEYQFHEIDAVNIARQGRRWFGEVFDINNVQEFDFNIPNVVTSMPIMFQAYTAAVSLADTQFKFEANGQAVSTITLSKLSDHILATAGATTTTIAAAENIKIKVTYENNGVPGSKGYLDYIRLRAKRQLTGVGKQFPFQYDAALSTTGIGEYQLANAANINQVWDITDIYNVKNAENNATANFTFKTGLGELRKYVAVDFRDFYVPSTETQSRITNQNLKASIFSDSQGQPGDVDYIIVTPAVFNAQAERLANFHRNYSQLNVKVINLDQIYQEFSSGKQDIGAIRNFIKYVYRNPLNSNRRIKYLNLFGDASFDFKDRISIRSNFVPIHHALNSYTDYEVSSCADDYFVLLDPNEGNVDANGSRGVDVAVGRMIAGSTQQADELVKKVIDYNDIQSYGSWRNNIVSIADDSDQSADRSLQQRMNTLTDNLVSDKPFLNPTKIYLDAYIQEAGSGGKRYPKAKQDIFDAFERGALVFNYLGHGGEDFLAQERIFTKTDAQTLNNPYKYPLFITITCQFSRFDNPFNPTAGEYTYWNPSGGAVSMITTVKAISQISGENFNDILSDHLFPADSNEYVSMAEALRLAKTESNDNMRLVMYLGDPALMLAIPKPKIRLTKLNDLPISETTAPLSALSYVKLTGEILDESDNPLPSYKGELAVQIFDKTIVRATLNNDTFSPPMNFNTLGETIFRGNASVNNGQFEFGFVVPRDITVAVDNGRASFYSKRNQIFLDKTGYDNTIKVGGINENAETDTTGPTVKLYMNDQSFVNGGITNESPIFLAFLEDEHGINTASGIGHDIVAILDGDETKPYKLNDYYETELDNYKKGKLKFPFRNLAVGLHTITFKAWDVYNNPITAEIQFVVVGDESITITNVLNYPNPFVNYTQFWFTHNKPFEPLEVQVQVITITGKVVWTKNQTITTDGFLSREITWDGKDDFGDKIGKGVYVYKLTVKSMYTNTKTHKYEKLVIL